MSKPWTYSDDKFLAAWFDPKQPDCMDGRTPASCISRAKFLKRLGIWEGLRAAYDMDESYPVIMDEVKRTRAERRA